MINLLSKKLIINLTLLTLFTIFIQVNTFAKPSSKKERVKQQALDLIRSNSEYVSTLAGLTPFSADSIKFTDFEDSEELSEDVEFIETEDLDEEIIGDEGEDLEELDNYNDNEIDIDLFKSLWLAYVDAEEDNIYTDYGTRKDEMMEQIMDWLGTPYRFGGTTSRAIDCSAFTQTIFKETIQIELPRTANYQYNVGEVINNFEELKFGDLVFFNTRNYAYATHVGIYLGDMLFAHASSRYGVTVSSLNSKYYNKRFIGGRRLSNDDIMKYTIIETENKDEKLGG